MIPSRRSPLFTWWFARHARARIHGTFGRVRVHGLEGARAALATSSALVVANHTAWWDALVILHASRHLLGAEAFAMMDGANLARLPFFGLVGAFGVDRSDPRDGARAIQYAARLLREREAGRAVWVFAQGREVPITARPLAFEGGAAEIARVARRATALPVALRYEFGEGERPDLYLSFGPPAALARGPAGQGARDVARLRAALEAGVERELDRIEEAVRGRDDAFVDVHRAGEGWGARLATSFLSGLTRPLALPAAGGRGAAGGAPLERAPGLGTR